MSPFDEAELLPLGIGITNFVNRATATADELSADVLKAGARSLERTVKRYKPRYLALCGVGAYRIGFGRPKAVIGLQEESIGSTRIWVLPNPSGLNAHYQPADLAKVFRKLHDAAF